MAVIRRQLIPVLVTLLLGVMLVACTNAGSRPTPADRSSGIERAPGPSTEPSAVVTETTRLAEVMATPEFAGFRELVFPSSDRITDEMTVADTGRLLPYHSNIDPAEVAETLNMMLAGVREGTVTFHPVYGDEEIAKDPAKADVGLFFFRGEPGAPFAIVAPGGGFAYVGSIHEGFPYARVIAEHGHHAFVLNYRVGGGGRPATEDLAHAIDYVFENREALGVSTDGYSLWGSSAGARMAANLGSYGTAAFGAVEHPRASTVVMAYTGHSDYTADDPATFAVVGAGDGIASPRTMRSRIDNLNRLGIATEFHLYDGIGHGFGLGTGTVAEGWINNAIGFWERQIGEG